MKAFQGKNDTKDIFEMLPQAIAVLKKNIISPFLSESLLEKYANEMPPLRAELFSAGQIEEYAKKLAKSHTLITEHPSEQLLKRLAGNEDALVDVHRLLTQTVKDNQRITPAGEWLLDNFYLIEEQIYTGKKHLPKGYSKGLPQLKKGSSTGLPRVYDIAVEIISHSDGRVDLDSLTGFITAYQSVTPLKLGELWAIPIMLRLALIENLRRLATQIAIDMTYKKLAEYWADEMINTADNDPKNLVLVIADMSRSKPPMVGPFVAELTRKLQGKGSALSLPLTWIEQHVLESGMTSNELVGLENQKQASDQVSISNSISSLRFLGANDWRDFVEATSIVEQTLSQDPGGVYRMMDFFTRDRYRHAVEKIAKGSYYSEQEIAAHAIKLARENDTRNDVDARTKHVGYYLVDKGALQVEKFAGMKLSVRDALKRVFNKIPLISYVGSIFFLTALFSWPLLTKAHSEEMRQWEYIITSVLIIIGTSQLALHFTNWLATLIVKPSLLPRLNFSTGIPESDATMVVVPTMLLNTAEIDELLESLEVRFLANRDAHLYFALLTDFKDAKEETLSTDTLLLQTAEDKITALNKKYGSEKNAFFFLFHRPRKFNPNDNIWMGYERKRGKLGELNALLRGHGRENFSLIVGDESVFPSIKYIITLDTDTKLPRDTAWKMVGTIAHPLNHAIYSEKKKRIIHGYTILQPRVSNSLPAPGSSVYARIHGNEPGTDPYTRVISDVYQDIFQEGSFIGKGIYEIDAFEKVLNGRFPDNRILSHDLLEGCYSRSGLVSDVQLYEEYPSSYQLDVQRRHRWIRGDWQIAKWFLPFVPKRQKGLEPNPLSALSKWKIFDNLRRSLVPLSLTLLLLYGWLFSGAAWFWSIAIIFIIGLPAAISLGWNMIWKPKDVIFTQHVIYSVRSARDHFAQHAIDLIFLPYEAIRYADAILRTGWRMWISHKKLLEWNPSRPHSKNNSILGSLQAMWFVPVVVTGLFLYFAKYDPVVLFSALPFLIIWFISPFISWWISTPTALGNGSLSEEHGIFLHKLSRKTWSFFETFVGDEDNWLPPDNYQEEPVERIAHRTSPTNMGLALLSNLSAYDFRYITASQLLERTTNTIGTMQRMERFRGHFYNWYDTISLQPLHPRYISTVDSGNLAGHLLTLKQGLIALPHDKIVRSDVFDGILDTARVLAEKAPGNIYAEQLKDDIIQLCANRPKGLIAIKFLLDKLQASCGNMSFHVKPDPEDPTYEWLQKLTEHIQATINDLLTFLPWLLIAVPAKFSDAFSLISVAPTFYELAKIEEYLLPRISGFYKEENAKEEEEWLDQFRIHIIQGSQRAKEFILITQRLTQQCVELSTMDYDFLYDRSQHLLSIGYNFEEQKKDNSYYDLLASEARLATFVAIAQGKLPQESWFALGRQLTNVGTTPLLLSWSGSMFEYLMPMLIMPSYGNTLLDETTKGIVEKQIEYGKKRGVPWGISESGYNLVDANLNYQYHAFGVPGTGFKRGLGEDLVIAPYATEMSLMVSPAEACRNLKLLQKEGFEGAYGFYEAVDYTPGRTPRRQSNVVIRSYMAHHKGMGFLSLAYCLLDQPMQKRFEAEVQFKATLLILQERVPRITSFYSPAVHIADAGVGGGSDTSMRVITTPHTPVPEVQLLSNGRYHTMVTNAGGGYSRWKDIAVTRWREDSTCDNWGTFCFIRDLETGNTWSAAYQPTLKQGDNYEAVFSQGRAEFRRRDLSLETHTEVVVSPEDDVELRRVHITNRSRRKMSIEITSYAEVVLAPDMADASHPAFSNLFVQTEIVPQRQAIVCTRRPRSADAQMPWMFHLMKVHDAEITNVSYETDRSKFIGRGNTIHHPASIEQAGPLSGTAGFVLDPVIAIQYRIVIEPQQSAMIDMVIGIGDTKEICDGLVEKYQDRHMANRALELAWTHSQVILRQIDSREEEAQLYGRLAGSIIFMNPSMRIDPAIIIKNHRGQSGLWGYAISGDVPIVLLQIEDSANIELAQQMIQAHAYWRLKGLIVDLVIWNEDHGGYRQTLQNQLLGLIATGISANVKEQPGGIFIRSADQISNEDRILFQTIARVVISGSSGTLEEQVNRRNKLRGLIPYFSPTKFHATVSTALEAPKDLQFFNGIGGFSKDGKEYVITTSPSKKTPAPWINVLANPHFGTIISESGQSYTWVENAHEFRLTPWQNDPVSDKAGETFYLRDEESGRFWSPMPLPQRGRSPYITRHGFGYSIFEYSEDGIYSELCVFVDIADSIKFITLKLHNRSGRPRRLSATGYMEWVLGDLRPKYQMHVITEADPVTGAILARNEYNTAFENRVAFFDVSEPNRFHTGDRAEFIGRNGTLANPEGMNKSRLSGKTGAGLDPCAVLQVVFDLPEGDEKEIIFRLGVARDTNDARAIIKKYKEAGAAATALLKVKDYWNKTLNAVQIQTPDAALNILTNGWLIYQTHACRIWGRSGFYQSGGAFGYRDQLQDMLALLHSHPELVREHILLCASRQFKEGDVQHWWHPPAGRGVRTTCSDDFLWLAYVTARYVKTTGDTSVLDVPANYIEGRLLNVDEESYYDLPIRSDQSNTIYEHCIRAIEHGMRYGEHGLPLMGSGDWNDGMDKVGEHGKGESVWLGFFLYDILNRFMELAKIKNDDAFLEKCRVTAEQLKKSIADHAWDGNWYRRAYFDDGTPLGSVVNDECRIDSLPQSWSVLSGAGDKERSRIAMGSADQYLVKRETGIIQLFDPPFDKSSLNPGYIKGYVPGVRENGGQYTHAAIWLTIAFARMGNRERAWELIQMINPINHGSDKAGMETYKVEPYVIAADVYGVAQHKGRGGWTWYTGSAGWMYQLILENFIGLKKEGDRLYFTPAVPKEWGTFSISYRYMDTVYNLTVKHASHGQPLTVILDGEVQSTNMLVLVNDGKPHNVEMNHD
ncbi:MAG: glucoamylase family protein [Bacteroidota bacterium]